MTEQSVPPLIELSHVSKRYWLRKNRSGELKVRFLSLLHKDKREVRDELWALRDVSISIGPGESVGLIGRNGSGKSTLLKLVAGIHRPTSGEARVARGMQIGTLIELGIGFHMELTGRENVYLNAAIHGLTAAQIDAIYPAVVEYSGLRDFMDAPLKNYSSGMQMRLAFSVAANLDPDVLLLDEIFAVGDEEFQKQCRRTIDQFLADGKTILFVSHSMSAIRDVCRRVCLLEHGELLFDGSVDEGLQAYDQLMHAPLLQAAAQAHAEADTEAVAGSIGLDFLRTYGVRPTDYVVEIGGADPAVRGFLQPGHYFARRAAASVDLAGLPPLDVISAPALLSDITPEWWGPALVTAVRALSPFGRLFVAPPTSRPLPVVEHIAAVAGGQVAPVRSSDGTEMLVIRRIA